MLLVDSEVKQNEATAAAFWPCVSSRVALEMVRISSRVGGETFKFVVELQTNATCRVVLYQSMASFHSRLAWPSAMTLKVIFWREDVS